LRIFPGKIPIILGKTPVFPGIMPQRKRKENKVKEMKGKGEQGAAPCPPIPRKYFPFPAYALTKTKFCAIL
jgi:hypothetical protein